MVGLHGISLVKIVSVWLSNKSSQSLEVNDTTDFISQVLYELFPSKTKTKPYSACKPEVGIFIRSTDQL